VHTLYAGVPEHKSERRGVDKLLGELVAMEVARRALAQAHFSLFSPLLSPLCFRISALFSLLSSRFSLLSIFSLLSPLSFLLSSLFSLLSSLLSPLSPIYVCSPEPLLSLTM
jgi:hypothetical protein